MPAISLKLYLDNPHRVYHTGTVITGKVEVTCSVRTGWGCDGITLQLVGEGKVRATAVKRTTVYNYDTNKDEEYIRRTHKTNEKRFLDKSVILHHPPNDTLAFGVYYIPFQIHLPEGLPSTFSGGRGKVRYFFRYRGIKNGWQDKKYDSSDKNCTGIVVLGLHNTNKMPHAHGKRTLTCSRKNWSLFGAKNQVLSGMLQYPRGAFVPGEVMPLSGYIDNQTSLVVEAVVIYIEQRVEYEVDWTRTYIENKYGYVRKKGVGAGCRVEWSDEPYIIPPLPASGMNELFPNIDVSYKLKIMFKIPGYGYDTQMKLETVSSGDELLIGNVPLELYCETTGKSLPVEINAVSYCRVSDPWKPSLFPRLLESLYGYHLDSEDTSGSNWGTESCVPLYPVFDLQRDSGIISKEYEVV